MSARLAELRRQRALVQQHLAWLDAEIAAVDGKERHAPPPAFATPVAPVIAAPAAPTTINPADTDALLAHYGAEERTSPRQVKLGCWIAFIVLFTGFWGAVGVWYFLKTRA